MKNNEEKVKKITFFSNSKLQCPVCGDMFYREELLSGGGRLIAGSLTDELRRLYEPSVRFGEIHPLIYPIIVCPSCYYATFTEDFKAPDKDVVSKLESNTAARRKTVSMLFPKLNFRDTRDLPEGTASYILALSTYECFKPHFMPTFKRGLCCLRAAWLFNDLHRKHPEENYDYAAMIFYRKAKFFYSMALERDQKGQEALNAKANFGPDTDKNYGYDGILYLSGYLEYKYAEQQNMEIRKKSLEYIKRLFSKIFGIGKASKDKPSVILEKAKDIYAKISEEVKTMEGNAAGETQ
ncbi:MAG: DUF2225 domain-containing protein [Spirochaetales bacterium]|nr:DUF2225 domain-containing protein [Spirochaetales bacterium]